MLKKIKETAIHGAVYGVGQAVSQAVGFLLIPLYTQHLSTSEYGLWALLSLAITVLVAIFGLGLNSALFRSYYLYDNESDRKKVVSTSFYILLSSNLILFVTGYLGASYWSKILVGNEQHARLCMYIFWTAGLTLLETIPFAVYRAKMLSQRYIFFTLIFIIVRIALIIYYVAYAGYGVWGVVLGNFLATLIATIVFNATIINYLIPRISMTEARRLLRYGLPLVITGVGGVTLNFADRYILNSKLDLDTVGVYNLGAQVGMVMTVLLVQPVALIWSPMLFSVAKEPYARDYYSKMLTYVYLVGMFLWLGLSTLSPDVIKIVAQPDYWHAYKVVPFIAFSSVMFTLTRLVNVGVGLSGRTEFNALVIIICAPFHVIMNILLIPKFGMMGSAYVSVLSFTLMVIMRYFISSRLYFVKYEWKRLIKISIATLILFGVSSLIKTDTRIVSLVIKTFIVLTLPLVLFIFRFYHSEELHHSWSYTRYIILKVLGRWPKN